MRTLCEPGRAEAKQEYTSQPGIALLYRIAGRFWMIYGHRLWPVGCRDAKEGITAVGWHQGDGQQPGMEVVNGVLALPS